MATTTTAPPPPPAPAPAAAPTPLLVLGAALTTVTLWASAFVGIRAAGQELSAGALTLGRLLVGTAALGALAPVRRERLPPSEDLPRLLIVGVLWFGFYNLALNEA